MKRSLILAFIVGLSSIGGALGCDEVPSSAAAAGASGASGAAGTAGTAGAAGSSTGQPDPYTVGDPFEVTVPETGRVFVDLDKLALAGEKDNWDLAFEGRDIFSNGGDSGIGKGAAFGPLDLEEFLLDVIPEHPFLIRDADGSAFARWYAYDSMEHVLYGRYHVFGVRRAMTLYKVQILGFYGEVQGAPVAAVYSLRYAHASSAGVDPTVTLMDVDATAGGSMGTDADPSACINLETAKVDLLLPADAAKSAAWDICLRRANISVNGKNADVTAVDLDREKTEDEKLQDVMKLTADSELPRFEAVKYDDLADPSLPWAGDRILSAFTDKWTEPGVSPLEPSKVAWLVAGADGYTPFLVLFESLKGATADNPGTVRMRVKKLKKTF
jgi:hypothetical protein